MNSGSLLQEPTSLDVGLAREILPTSFEYWNNPDFYRAVYRNKIVKFQETKISGASKIIVGIAEVSQLLSPVGHKLKIYRNELSKYKKRPIKFQQVNANNLQDVKLVGKGWNAYKRHFMTWKGQGERFISDNYTKYPCYLFYYGDVPVGYNAFFPLTNDVLVWAVSKAIDGENGLSSYMMYKSLLVNNNFKYLNLTSYGSQAKYKRHFNPVAEKTFYQLKGGEKDGE